MNILPTQRKSLGDPLMNALGHNTEEINDFYDELVRQQNARKAVQDEEAVNVQSARDFAPERRTPLKTAPYSRNTTDGVTYSTDEVCFTKRELNDLYRKLENAGAPAESMQDFATLMQQPDGATLSQVVASLHHTPEPPVLTETEISALSSLTNKIDPSGHLSEKVSEALQEGKPQAAWKHINDAINHMEPGTTITVERSEVAALGKALGLSPNAQQQLMGNFGPYSSITMTAKQFSGFLAPASHDLMRMEQNQQKLDKALDETLKPILDKARKRMEAEKSAHELSNRRTEQSKVLIEKTVMHKVNETLNGEQRNADGLAQATAVGKVGGNSSMGAMDRIRNKINVDAEEKGDAMPRKAHGVDGDNLRNTHDAHRETSPTVLVRKDGQNDAPTRDPRDRQGDKDAGRRNPAREGWDPLLRKVEVRSAPTSQNLLFGTAAQTQANGHFTIETGKPVMPAPRQTLSQVEQAMLSAMRDGTKRLDIQLDPVDLGTLTLTLTSRNGEVSATIRSERGETADMIARQLDVLRTNLEQQGIKVDKLEVQNQAADNDSRQQWENMQQHNARQEEAARRENLDRLRSLARHRNTDSNSDGTALEQGVQSLMHTAGNAAQGIYIIA